MTRRQPLLASSLLWSMLMSPKHRLWLRHWQARVLSFDERLPQPREHSDGRQSLTRGRASL